MFNLIEILKELHPESDYLNSDDYIRDGMLDSYDIIALVSEIEVRYGVIIDGKDIIPENFRNIETIEVLIKKIEACKVYRR